MLRNPEQSAAYDDWKLDNDEDIAAEREQVLLDARCEKLQAAIMDVNRLYNGKRIYADGRIVDAEVTTDASDKGRLSLVVEGLDLGLEPDDWLEALRWAVRDAKCLPREAKT